MTRDDYKLIVYSLNATKPMSGGALSTWQRTVANMAKGLEKSYPKRFSNDKFTQQCNGTEPL